MTKGLVILSLVISMVIMRPEKQDPGRAIPTAGQTAIINCFRSGSIKFAASTRVLKMMLDSLQEVKGPGLFKVREALKTCRMDYKRIEFFMAYFFPVQELTYNGAAKVEVEEPTPMNAELDYIAPTGMQVIEALLFEKNVDITALRQQAELIASSAETLPALLYHFSASDARLLEALKLELVRIYTLGLTGYDAPLLKTGLQESRRALATIDVCLQPFLEQGDVLADSIKYYMKGSLAWFNWNNDFDRADRAWLLYREAMPLLHTMNRWMDRDGLEVNTTGMLNYSATNLFSPDALNVDSFGTRAGGGDVAMGRRLFSDNRLSGNGRVSCATCHQPGNYFVDGLPRSVAFDGHSTVARNAPSLFYTAYQHLQFWDGRAKNLEQQILDVLTNPREMNSRLPADSLQAAMEYARDIAAYVRTLAPFRSSFDRWWQGDASALTHRQRAGFNLFMGKALCATCHFAPLFNGLTPPLYKTTELEVLNLPQTQQLLHAGADTDRGRYNIFPITYYDKAFKTPGLRNVAVTAPYMHNGAFPTLESVIDFYNKGGGNGIGLYNDHQTLSQAPLHLSTREKSDLVAFLRSLTDKYDQKTLNNE